MAVVLADGTLDGAGTLTGLSSSIFNPPGLLAGTGDFTWLLVRVRNVVGLLDGADGITSTNEVKTLLVGGQAYGAGTLTDELETLVSGTLAGSGTLVGTPVRLLWGNALPMAGSGSMWDHFPLPMVGHGDLFGYLEVVHVPDRCPPDLKTFRWMQRLGIGDLEHFTKDARGMPYSPIVCLYALYQVLPGGVKVLSGPPNRRPVQQGVGRYYATGTAGDCGQPGEWVIQWRCQRFWYDPPTICETHFLVQDAVAAGPPDPTVRSCKKGWL